MKNYEKKVGRQTVCLHSNSLNIQLTYFVKLYTCVSLKHLFNYIIAFTLLSFSASFY